MPDRLSPQLRAVLWMVMTATTFALSLVAIRALAPKFSPSEITFFRVFLGALLLAPWVSRSGVAVLGGVNVWRYLACGGAAFVGIATWNWAVPRMALADATALNFTLPLFTILFAVLFIGEAASARRIGATLAGFAGVLVILRPGFTEVSLPALVALGNPAAFAIAVVLIRVLSQSAGSVAVNFNMHAVMVPLALAASVVEGWVTPTVEDLPWVLAVGVLGIGSYVGVIRTVALTSASFYAPLDFLRLPAATLVAFAVFAERPSVWTWIGAAIIFAAIWYTARLDAGGDKSPS